MFDTVLSLLQWIIDDVKNEIKIIIALSVVLLLLITFFVKTYFKYNKLKNDYNDLKVKHTALSKQFKSRTHVWQEYKNFTYDLNYMLNFLMIDATQEKFKNLFDWYLKRTSNLNHNNTKGDPYDY